MLNNTLISGHNVDSENRGSTIEHNESLTLNFDKIEIRYTPYDEENNMGTPISNGYNIATATKF